MDVKEFLAQTYRIEEKISHLKDLLQSVESGMRGQNFNNIGAKVNKGFSSETETRGIKALKYRDKISAETENLYQIKIDIFEAISSLKSVNEQLVLTYKYIDRLTWDKISLKMGYSETHLKRIHKKALSNLQKEVKDYDGAKTIRL